MNYSFLILCTWIKCISVKNNEVCISLQMKCVKIYHDDVIFNKCTEIRYLLVLMNLSTVKMHYSLRTYNVVFSLHICCMSRSKHIFYWNITNVSYSPLHIQDKPRIISTFGNAGLIFKCVLVTNHGLFSKQMIYYIHVKSDKGNILSMN